MIDHVIKQIKRIRKEKGFSQKGLGDHFTVNQSGLSKVENQKIKLDIERLAEIAKALEVDITEFFPKPKSANRFEDGFQHYGYASKADIEEITFLIKQLRQDMAALRKDVASLKTTSPKKKKNKLDSSSSNNNSEEPMFIT